MAFLDKHKVIETNATPWAWHRARFAQLAAELEGAVYTVVISFLQLYRHLAARMDRLAADNGFEYRYFALNPGVVGRRGQSFTVAEMHERAAELAAIAAEHGMSLQACCCPPIVDPAAGINAGRCLDPDLVRAAYDVTGRPAEWLDLRPGPSRGGCGCVASRDVGVYDTCLHGCADSYCYASHGHARAAARSAEHDPLCEAMWRNAAP